HPAEIRRKMASAQAPIQALERKQLARADYPQSPPPPAAAVAPQIQGRPVVVVDPGHGGHDPGTRSDSGVLEKDLALQIASRVADALARRGVNPVLTRNRDEYLSLAQRTAIANQARAE